MSRTRTQAERDAVTVEIGFALVTGAVLAGLCFLAFAGAGAVLPVPDERVWMMLAKGTSVTVFIARVLQVLLPRPSGPAERQPSQPGRTRPDS
ncbi:MAG TPA: DUF6332 family protein [Streptomyces sp.]|nr:DUF6332 family protein [Streptomyces sp.]